jgi:hypothetical protein
MKKQFNLKIQNYFNKIVIKHEPPTQNNPHLHFFYQVECFI